MVLLDPPDSERRVLRHECVLEAGRAQVMPLISIVVTTFNRQPMLEEALASIRDQTVEDFECIVVDDGSSTPTRLPFTDARFKVVRLAENSGISSARNHGLRRSTGQFVTFLDDDDLWTPRRLEIGLRHAGPGCVSLCGTGSIGSMRTNPRRFTDTTVEEIMSGSPPILGAAMISRSECPAFNPSYLACEDLDWWLSLPLGTRLMEEAELGWLHRRHDGVRLVHGTRARVEGSERLLAEHADFFRRHPRAAAYRRIRIGWMELELGHRHLARREVFRALALNRSVRTLGRSLRLLLRSLPRGSDGG